LREPFQTEVIVKNPAKNLNRFFPAFRRKIPDAVNFGERENKTLDFFDSDLHGSDVTMMAEVYGSDFQKVWKKTRKKWWA
jgi:phosphosulfolactate phosphohydrolase-like enzyme